MYPKEWRYMTVNLNTRGNNFEHIKEPNPNKK